MQGVGLGCGSLGSLGSGGGESRLFPPWEKGPREFSAPIPGMCGQGETGVRVVVGDGLGEAVREGTGDVTPWGRDTVAAIGDAQRCHQHMLAAHGSHVTCG